MDTPSALRLVRPQTIHLPSYCAALRRAWSPDTTRPQASAEQLEQIERDAPAFVALMEDREGAGPPVTLPDGSQQPRIPSLRRWMWLGPDEGDGFVGTIGLRWMRGGAPLPPHVLGHAGYAVVPWHRRQGHATRALALMLPLARELGLPELELTTDPDNEPSQRVIAANGGVLRERFDKGAAYGHKPGLRFVITL